jgi:transposase
MGRPIGPKKVHRYSAEFKLTAVKLTKMPGVEVQTVAEALDIHPFMLSRWRKEAREGVLRGKAKRIEVEPRRAREIKRLQALERAHAILKAEHELLKKAIRFSSARRRRSSSSSLTSGARSTSGERARSTA